MENKVKHPFEGGRKTAGITLRHRALIWENMLGTVMAYNPKVGAKYFDYDWNAARAFAGVARCADLRISRAKYSHTDGLRKGQVALWGIIV